MTVAYRVLRPYQVDKHRRDMVVKRHGCIVFRFENDGAPRFWVTGSGCSSAAAFSMDVASRICDDRAAQIRDNDPCSMNGCFVWQPWDVMRSKVLEFFETYEPKDDTPAELYRAAEFKRIAEAAKLIIEQNESELSLMRVAEEALINECIKEMYASIDALKG